MKDVREHTQRSQNVSRAASFCVAFGLACSLATGSAWAQQPCALDKSHQLTYRKALGEAKLLQVEGKHREAIRAFKRAYLLCDAPELLRLISQSYEVLGDEAMARRYAKAHRSDASFVDGKTKTVKLSDTPVATLRLEEVPNLPEDEVMAKKWVDVVPPEARPKKWLPVLSREPLEAAPPLKKQEPVETANLSITSSPAGAWVLVYPNLDSPIAQTPTPEISLPVGKTYRIIVHKKGYKSVDKEIKVSKQSRTQLHLTLEVDTYPKL